MCEGYAATVIIEEAALRRADPALAEAVAHCTLGPDLEVRGARSGAISLCVGGRLECSLENPLAEARELAQHFLARDRKSTRLNSSHTMTSRMPSSA